MVILWQNSTLANYRYPPQPIYQTGVIMESTALFTTALQYEEKIRDLYHTAAASVDDPRGKAIFLSLADDEQSHIDFLHYSIGQLQSSAPIDLQRLSSQLPDQALIEKNINKLQAMIPKEMLGDIKTVLNSALQMEKETSAFYRDACARSTGEIKKIFERFLVIEDRHVDLVQIELDHAMQNGVWFNFMEINLEAE
jgi:rubrerythrin